MNLFEDLQGLTEDDGPQFNNLVVDKNTGRVYIGAVNKLYQLSPNLEPTVGFKICWLIVFSLTSSFTNSQHSDIVSAQHCWDALTIALCL